MKIAVTSQNRKTITEHGGKCRKFWIFDTDDQKIVAKTLLELTKEQSFHESSAAQPHPLDEVDVLIAGCMGQGLMKRLESKNIKTLITDQSDPETAALLYLQGQLKSLPAHQHHHDHATKNKIKVDFSGH